MSRFNTMGKLELRARLSDIDRNIHAENRRLTSLQNDLLELQDSHQIEAAAQTEPMHRIAATVGLLGERQEAQRQREFLIGYRKQAIDEIKNNIAILETERENIKETLMMRQVEMKQARQI